MNQYLVEHYWPGITRERLQDATRRLRSAAAAIARDGKDIRYLRSTLVPGDEVALVVFAASSAELVAEAYARAGVSYDRIVAALELERVARSRRAASSRTESTP
jgi:hypothetical protein